MYAEKKREEKRTFLPFLTFFFSLFKVFYQTGYIFSLMHFFLWFVVGWLCVCVGCHGSPSFSEGVFLQKYVQSRSAPSFLSAEPGLFAVVSDRKHTQYIHHKLAETLETRFLPPHTTIVYAPEIDLWDSLHRLAHPPRGVGRFPVEWKRFAHPFAQHRESEHFVFRYHVLVFDEEASVERLRAECARGSTYVDAAQRTDNECVIEWYAARRGREGVRRVSPLNKVYVTFRHRNETRVEQILERWIEQPFVWAIVHTPALSIREISNNPYPSARVLVSSVIGSDVQAALREERVGIIDSGLDTRHIDFRLKDIVYVPYMDHAFSTVGSDHGTHVAGIAFGDHSGVARAASGALFDVMCNTKTGCACDARFAHDCPCKHMYASGKCPYAGTSGFLTLPAHVDTMWSELAHLGARVLSNSYGFAYIASLFPMTYGVQSQNIDEYTWLNPDVLVAFASGNDGKHGTYGMDEFSLSKNALVVGSSGSNTAAWGSASPISYEDLDASSSYGPTFPDTRVKPDIVAPGMGVWSARSGTIENWVQKTGTSMASPGAAGVAALVRAALRARYAIANPGASLVKAILINHASILPGRIFKTATTTEKGIPSWRQGHGRVAYRDDLMNYNITRILVHESHPCVQSDDVHTFAVTYTTHTCLSYQVSATLAWTDPPGDPAAFRDPLVNDLDLRLQCSLEEPVWGNAYMDSRIPDRRNTIEKARCNVVLSSVLDGAITVKIRAYCHRIHTVQPYSLVITRECASPAPYPYGYRIIASSEHLNVPPPPSSAENPFSVPVFGCVGASSVSVHAVETCQSSTHIDDSPSTAAIIGWSIGSLLFFSLVLWIIWFACLYDVRYDSYVTVVTVPVHTK